MNKCSWPLGNGYSLTFNIYSENRNWKQIAGLYIYAFLASSGSWIALYVGQTDDFSSRFPSREKLSEAIQLGATHIHALAVPLQSDRDRYEELLIRNLQPRMNVQLKEVCRF
jgi:hypothetical protein